MVNLTRAMAIDHGPQGIRVNCVCPGDTDTPHAPRGGAPARRARGGFLAEAADRPLARIGTPEDIARAMLFLVTEAPAG